MYPFIMQGNQITIVIDNKPHQIGPTHIAYEKIKTAIKDGDWDVVKDMVEPKEILLNYSGGNIEIVDNRLYWNGIELHNSLTARIISMYKEGFSIAPMVKFISNLMENPSQRAVKELYGFLEKNTLPITEDGYFLAYKKVRENYLDVYSGTLNNSIGEVLEMPRNQVDDDANRTCSAGLHFCSIEYLKSFGGERTVILKINPRDVVSIPIDYDNAKGRCCRYEVVGEIDQNKPESAFKASVDTQYKSKPVSKKAAKKAAAKSAPKLRKNATGHWIRPNGTYASKEEIEKAMSKHRKVAGVNNGIKQNSAGQWIYANGTYVPKHLIPGR